MFSLQSYDQLRVIVEDEFTAAEEVREGTKYYHAT